MSELRARCEELADSILDDVARYGISSVLRKNAVVELEAFAKQEQIKGMEAARDLTHTHHAPFHWYFEWLRKKIDAAIKQLKDGG